MKKLLVLLSVAYMLTSCQKENISDKEVESIDDTSLNDGVLSTKIINGIGVFEGRKLEKNNTKSITFDKQKETLTIKLLDESEHNFKLNVLKIEDGKIYYSISSPNERSWRCYSALILCAAMDGPAPFADIMGVALFVDCMIEERYN